MNVTTDCPKTAHTVCPISSNPAGGFSDESSQSVCNLNDSIFFQLAGPWGDGGGGPHYSLIEGNTRQYFSNVVLNKVEKKYKQNT